MRRRHLLAGSAAALGAGLAAAAWRYWPDEGFWNPCRAALPQRLAGHELVRAAWEGIDARAMWDAHAHLVGSGDSGSGIYVDPQMESLLSPGQYARRLFLLNAGCAHDAPDSVDRAYVEWAASVHPYRRDAVEALEKAKLEGARAVKWLPSAMGIDPGSPRCDVFYQKLKDLNLPLVSHAGEERAVPGSEAHDFGNPLRLRRALDAGVRVVAAHCASLGQDRDLDRGGALVDSFSLFERLMQEASYEKLLFGDISAMTQVNRAGAHLAAVIERSEWHPRLLNGSDYPLPGVMPIYSVDYLVSLGLARAAAAPVLKEIRQHNPLLYDFVLKRHLRSRGKAFAARIFETRKFFE